MTLRITVTDVETGDTDSATVREGDYIVIAHAPCRVEHTQVYGSGSTHIVTIKDRIERGVVLPPPDPDDEPIPLVPTGARTTNSQEGAR